FKSANILRKYGIFILHFKDRKYFCNVVIKSLSKLFMKSQEVQTLSYFLFPLQTYLERNSINEHNIDWIKNYLQRGTFLSILNYKQKIPKFQRVTVNPRILKENK